MRTSSETSKILSKEHENILKVVDALELEITQLKNISKGGMCFVTSIPIPLDTMIHVDLQTPYIAEVTYLNGIVRGCQENIKGMLYETRIEFQSLNKQSEILLYKMITFFENGEN